MAVMVNGKIKIHADERWMNVEWAIGGEYLWATPLGDGRFKIGNVPFFTRGLAIDDIVSVEDGEIAAVLEQGGQVPFTVVVNEMVPDVVATMLDRVKTRFPDARCEGGFDVLVAVNVPKAQERGLNAVLRANEHVGLVVAWETTR